MAERFKIHVMGIPALAEVTYYRPGFSGSMSVTGCITWGIEPEDVEFELLDRHGCRAGWLDVIADKNDLWADIYSDITAKMRAESISSGHGFIF